MLKNKETSKTTNSRTTGRAAGNKVLGKNKPAGRKIAALKHRTSVQSDRISTRIDADLKSKAIEIFAKLGLSEAEAIRLFYTQVTNYRGIPFSLKIPNEETLKAIEETEKGKVHKTKSLDDLYQQLEI